MKLKKIIIQNLATIEDAEIDFTSEPLKNASLFLICGDTGSGKSTITDALCLSLYGKTPRFESVEKEDITLEDSTVVKTSDSRHIIRYGKTGAFAATIFEAFDGKCYKAEWSVQRAGKKLSGTLHRAKNVLYVLNNQTFEPVTDLQREFDSKIEKLTSLNFDRFIRCTLLAQNQFSKFLYAGKEKKSEILQMLTDTAIYEKISIRIYEKYKESKLLVEQQDKLLENIHLLSEEEISKILADLNVSTQKMSETNSMLSKVQLQENWRKTFDNLDLLLKQKLLDKQNAENQKNNFIANELLIKQLEFVQDKLLPVKNNLERLKNETKINDDNFLNLEKLYGKLFGRYNFLLSKIAASESEISALETELNTLMDKKDIYQNIQTITSILDSYMSIVEKQNNEENRINNFKSKILENQKNKELLSNKLSKVNKDKETLKQELDNLNLVLQQFDFKDITQKEKMIDDKKKVINLAKNLFVEYDSLTQQLDRINKSVKDLKINIEKDRTLLQNLSVERKTALEVFELADSIYQLQLVASSKSVVELRKNLKKDSPCPVCGVPFSGHTEHIIENQLDIVKEKRLQADTKLRSIDNQIAALNKEKNNYQTSLQTFQDEFLPCQEKLSKVVLRLENAVKFFAEKDNLSLKSVEQLRSVLSEMEENCDKIFEELSQKKNDYYLKQGKEKATREKLDKVNFEVEKINLDIQNIQKEDAVLNNSLDNSLKNKNLLSTDMQDSIDKLSNFFPNPENIFSVIENALKFKQNLLQKTQKFNDLSQSIEEKRLKLKEFQHIEELSKQVKTDDIFSCFNNATILAILEDKNLETLPQDFAALKENTKNNSLMKISLLEQETKEKNDFSFIVSSANKLYSDWNFSNQKAMDLLQLPKDTLPNLKAKSEKISNDYIKAMQSFLDAKLNLENHQNKDGKTSKKASELALEISALKNSLEELSKQINFLNLELEKDKVERTKVLKIKKDKEKLSKEFEDWAALYSALGASDGKKLRVYAQNFTLNILLKNANYNLRKLSDKYQLTCQSDSLAIFVNDLEMGSERPSSTLSGGESFMVSLCLALGLSDMISGNHQPSMLFIDEGFGTLDENSLNHVITMLEKLKTTGRQVGIISHVKELQERISAKIRVKKTPFDNSKSTIVVEN